MSNKWADYGISAVSYSKDPVRIRAVMVHPDTGDSFGSPTEWLRESVIKAINDETTFVTILEKIDATGRKSWQKGSPVKVVVIKGKAFIKTEADNEEKDNLGALPRYDAAPVTAVAGRVFG